MINLKFFIYVLFYLLVIQLESLYFIPQRHTKVCSFGPVAWQPSHGSFQQASSMIYLEI